MNKHDETLCCPKTRSTSAIHPSSFVFYRFAVIVKLVLIKQSRRASALETLPNDKALLVRMHCSLSLSVLPPHTLTLSPILCHAMVCHVAIIADLQTHNETPTRQGGELLRWLCFRLAKRPPYDGA